MAGRLKWLTAAALLMVLTAGCSPDPPVSIQTAERAYLRRDLEQAEQAVLSILQQQPDSPPALLLHARVLNDSDRPEQAVQALNKIRDTSPELNVDAALLAAKIQHEQLYHFSAAEDSYHQVLAADSTNTQAAEGLCRLLLVCGRRREAVPLLLQLCRQQQASDLLIVLSRHSGMINDPQTLQQAHTRYPQDAAPLLGLARHAQENGDLQQAIQLCRQALQLQPALPWAYAELGSCLWLDRQYDQLSDWESQLTEDALRLPEVRRIQGLLAQHQGRKAQAVRYLLLAAQDGADMKDVLFSLSQLYQAAEQAETADRLSSFLQQTQHLEAMFDRMMHSPPSAQQQALTDVIEACAACGRIWEAYGWCQVALQQSPRSAEFAALFSSLQQQTAGLPLTLTAASANPVSSLNADALTFADSPAGTHSTAVPSIGEHSIAESELSFQTQTHDIGISFRYHNGIDGPTQRRMFEFTGGGIGVVDLDLDTYPDLLLTQGGSWDDRGTATNPGDRLLRNQHGRQFTDVSGVAGLQEHEFGQGTTVGDLNEDGFPDLFVGNIGRNRIWINNGDGTFHELTDDVAWISNDKWTTSSLMADIDGDSLADIYAVNYLTGSDVFDRICPTADGRPRACVPFHFDGDTNHFLHNNGDGTFTERAFSEAAGKSLGVAAWTPGPQQPLHIFVANDTTANEWLHFDQAGSGGMIDDAMPAGVALNASGKAEGCMGLAISDVNDDGQQDVFVTNFFNESNTLYGSLPGNTFQDQTDVWRLGNPSVSQLGFGTSFLDVNMDGFEELFVANGHVDDLRDEGKPWQMPPQLFQRTQDGFQLHEPGESGTYFEGQYLGRAVAVCDWNRDRRPDLVVGHLLEDSVMLTNTTQQTGQSLEIQLCGLQSGRLACGTQVAVRCGSRTQVRQLIAGGSYHASSEHVLRIGCGTAAQVDELTIRWPSGAQQRFQNVPLSARITIREDTDRLFPVP